MITWVPHWFWLWVTLECGAVGAAVDGGHAVGHVADIVEEITPSVTKAKQQETDSKKIADVAENLNVENSVKNLMESDVISKLVKDGKVEVKGCRLTSILVKSNTLRTTLKHKLPKANPALLLPKLNKKVSFYKN